MESQTNVLLNFIPIKSGGGQQVATNFIQNISFASNYNFNLYACCTEGTEVHRILEKEKIIKFYTVPNSSLARLFFNLNTYDKVIKKHHIDAVYTMFGPGLPKREKVINIVGCAYSNIFYPEINFWSGWPLSKRVLSKFIDRYRLKKTLDANAIVFENESMLLRANRLFQFPIEKTIYIKPSLSKHFNNKAPKMLAVEDRLSSLPNKKHLLVLTGWHVNKNIHMLPYIADALKRNNVKNVDFIITISSDHPGAQQVIKVAYELNVLEYIKFIGPFSPFELVDLYRKSFAVLLLSLLESFSNNIIEAWEMRRPLIVSDLEWARSICNNAAAYVNRDKSEDIASVIIKILNDVNYYNNLVSEGCMELKSYPTPKEKVIQQFEFIRRIVNAESF